MRYDRHVRPLLRKIFPALIVSAVSPAFAAFQNFQVDLGKPVESLAFSGDGAYLLAAPWDRSVRVISVPGRRQVKSIPAGGYVWDLAVSPDGSFVAAGGTARNVAQLSPASWDFVSSFTAHTDYVSALAVSPDGKTLVSGGWDGVVSAWDLRQGRPSAPRKLAFSAQITAAAFSGDGAEIAVALADGTVHFLAASALARSATLPGRYQAPACLAYSADGRWLALGAGAEVRVLDAASRTEARVLPVKGGALSVAFSGDSRRLAAASGGGAVDLWSAGDWKLQRSFPAKSAQNAVAFSPDSGRLASGGKDGAVTVWDLSAEDPAQGAAPAAGKPARQVKTLALNIVLPVLAGAAVIAGILLAVRRRARSAAAPEPLQPGANASPSVPAVPAPPREDPRPPEPAPPQPEDGPAGDGGPPALPEKFEYLNDLGRGSLGPSYLVKNTGQGRLEVFKRLRREVKTTPGAKAILFKEGIRLARLSHANIVASYDIAENGGELYLRSEYLEGRTVAQMLEGRALLPGPAALRVAKDVCSALMYAHSQEVVHGDIKPANIMVARDGVAKMTDFTIARALKDVVFSLPDLHDASGSPSFLPPEHRAGQPCDAAGDIYSLGVTLYVMATGVKPFHGATEADLQEKKMRMRFVSATEVDPSLPPLLDEVLFKCLQADKSLRFQSAEELLEKLAVL